MKHICERGGETSKTLGLSMPRSELREPRAETAYDEGDDRALWLGLFHGQSEERGKIIPIGGVQNGAVDIAQAHQYPSTSTSTMSGTNSAFPIDVVGKLQK